MTNLQSVCSVPKGSRVGGVCHEAKYHMSWQWLRTVVLILTKDSAVTGAQLSQSSSCLHWQCRFGCSNGWRSAIKHF